MANRTATVYMNCKTADGKWRYYPPSKAANGRLEPGVAIVNNRRTKFEDFNYYVSWYEGTDDKGKQKKRFEKCGTDATFAAARRLEVENSLHAEAAPARLAELVNAQSRLTIADAVATYLSDVSARRGDKTAQAYKWVMKLFTDNCSKTHLDQINQNDLRAVVRVLQAREVRKGRKVSKRTVFNQFQAINTFLRSNEIEIGKKLLAELNDYDEKVVDAYTKEEIKALFKECDEDERIVFKFFLSSGCREGEVAHTEWRDINFDKNTLHIQPKPDRGWRVKDKEDRFVPLPAALVAELKARRNGDKPNDLVFPNGQGRPEGHFLRKLQDIAERGELDGKWELHKFRKTFATMHHDAQISVRTIQGWLGHSSLEVTQAYLKGQDAKSKHAQEAANSTFAAFD